MSNIKTTIPTTDFPPLQLDCGMHGNVVTMAALSGGGGDGSRRRDPIVLAFEDAKISVLEFDDSIHGLRTSSMHCFEGPEWLHWRKGRESFARGPLVKVDPQGRCGGVLVYGFQMIILKAAQGGSGLVGDDDGFGSEGAISAHVESSYIVNLVDMDMKHVQDYTFVHGYIEPVMVILHEQKLTWAGRVSWKHHTCMISALSISTTLKQRPLIWSALNLPHDSYKLLAVPSPIGGVLVILIHYHSQIWQERNLVVFQNKIPNHTWIVKSALNRGREFVGANGIIPVVYNGSRSSPPSSIRCSPVNARFVKLNFDGSVVNQGAAVGFVIRNEKG